jgi:hypothetical protein
MFGGTSGRSQASDVPEKRTIYVLSKTNATAGKEIQLAKPLTVKIGATDGAFTEVVEGLNEGDLVIIGQNTQTTAASQVPQGTSPFTQRSPFGGGPRR